MADEQLIRLLRASSLFFDTKMEQLEQANENDKKRKRRI